MTSLIGKNPGMKFLALLIAIALWIVVAGEEESAETYTVPLDFTSLSRDRILSGDMPNAVQVRVRGSATVLRSLSADDLRIPIDVSRLRTGERAVEALSPGNVQGIPSGAAVTGITPEAIPLLVERRIQRTVHLQPRIEGSPAPGFTLADVELDPDYTVFEGPESELAPLSMTATEPILLDGRSQTFIAMVGVPLPSPRVRFVQPRPVKVTVHIKRAQ